MPPARTVILDSWAVLAWFQGEPSAKTVERLVLVDTDRPRLLMSAVNAGEVWHAYARRISEDVANERLDQVQMAGIVIVDADRDLALEAARYKSRHRIAYAGCFAAALAKRESGRVATGDPEFRSLEPNVSILWLK